MKKAYVTPMITGEEFEANEYVAACVTATVQCVYPGTASAKGDNGVYDDYKGDQSGIYVDNDGMWHGLCGYDAEITFDSSNGSGYESNNGVTQSNRPIWGVTGYDTTPGTYYGTRQSSDGAATYTHKGRIVVSYIDNTRPNHS